MRGLLTVLGHQGREGKVWRDVGIGTDACAPPPTLPHWGKLARAKMVCLVLERVIRGRLPLGTGYFPGVGVYA